MASTVWADNFAYAEAFDEEQKKYLGLRSGTGVTPSISPKSLLVKPHVAQQQLDAVAKPSGKPPSGTSPDNTASNHTNPSTPEGGSTTLPQPPDRPDPPVPETTALKRFHGSIELDALRVNRDIGTIVNEVIQHLTALHKAQVTITLEIEANIPEGVSDGVVRTITENCNTLKFKSHAFEKE